MCVWCWRFFSNQSSWRQWRSKTPQTCAFKACHLPAMQGPCSPYGFRSFSLSSATIGGHWWPKTQHRTYINPEPGHLAKVQWTTSNLCRNPRVPQIPGWEWLLYSKPLIWKKLSKCIFFLLEAFSSVYFLGSFFGCLHHCLCDADTVRWWWRNLHQLGTPS